MPHGAATSVDVTPPEGAPLAGYLARGDAVATGTHDPLTASLLLLTGSGEVCWVALDALCIDTATAGRIRAAVAEGCGIHADAVLVCCSHTHSGPATWFRPLPPAPSTMDTAAVDRLVAAIGGAAARLAPVPVTVEWAVAPDVGVGGNRYVPTGAHDATAGALTVHAEDESTVAMLLDYACHPTVLGYDNLRYSADYPSTARRLISEGTGGGAVAFLQGAAGDASTRFTRHAQTFAESERHGKLLASSVLRSLADSQALGGSAPRVRRSVAQVPTRALPSEADAAEQLAEAGAARQQFAQHDDPAARIARTRYEGALLQAGMVAAGVPSSVELPISVVTLGGVAWVHLPVEPFASYGFAIRAGSPFQDTRVIGYTDGYFGYLADSYGHAAGVYEALSSMFDPDGGELVVAAVLELLRS
ncbi:MAG: hypothetical protein ACRDRN_08385 [Sciscionella sp.]